MFQSATLKLTGWYLLIIMAVSLIFSVLVYSSAVNEVSARLQRFGNDIPHLNLPGDSTILNRARDQQADQASHNISTQLLYANLVVLIGGGFLSYALARRTLRPIEEAHEAQSRFTSDASHELRTPLAAMKTELEVALRDPKLSTPDMRLILESNLEEVDKLTALSTMLLALSKLDLNAIETERLGLRELTKEVLKRYSVPSSRIELTGSTKHDIYVSGNRSSLRELITILVDNALKYSPDNSRITIRLATRERHAMFTIANSGDGIDEADLPHIFERFYRADNSRTGGARSGYGLGLSLAKKIVELHHGDLSVSSAAGELTTFTFMLPIFKQN